LGVGRGAKNSSPLKNELVMNIQKRPQTWTDSLDKRLKRKKMDMRFGKWKVRSMYGAGSFRGVGEKISKYKLDWEYRKSDGTKVALNEQANIHCSMEKEIKIMNYV
jgi:hypothetical protein